MSEPPPQPMVEDPPESSQNAEQKPQLTEDILNALRQLQATPGMTPTPTATQPNSQEQQDIDIKSEPTPPPQSEWDQLRAQLREKPVDADGWLKLVDLAEESGDIEKIKETYEGMLETYPNTVGILRTSPYRNYI